MFKKQFFSLLCIYGSLAASDENSIETYTNSHKLNQVLAMSKNLNPDQLEEVINGLMSLSRERALESAHQEEALFNSKRKALQRMILLESENYPGFGQRWRSEESQIWLKRK